MNNQSTFALTSIALFLSLFFSLVEDLKTKEIPKEEYQHLVFPSLQSDNIEEITLTSGQYQLKLTKGTIGWNCAYFIRGKTLVEDRASQLGMKSLIEYLVNLKQALRGKYVSKWEQYGLGSMSESMNESLRLKYGKLQHTLRIGFLKKATNSFLVYARIDDNNMLIILDGRIKFWLKSIRNNPNFMRTLHTLHPIEKDIDIFFQNEKREHVILSKRKRKWFFIQKDLKERAFHKRCNSLFQYIKDMRIKRFIYKKLTIKDLAPVKYILGFQGQYFREYMLIGKKVNNNDYYGARITFNQKKIHILYSYVVSSAHIKNIPQNLDDFKSRYIANFDLQNISAIRREGKYNWRLQKKKKWRLIKPVEKEIEGKEVRTFLESIYMAQSQTFQKDVLKEPFSEKLVLRAKNGQINTLSWLEKKQDFLVQANNEKTIRIITKQKYSILDRNYLDFYNKRVDAFVFADVKKIILEKAGQKYDIEKKKKHWFFHEKLLNGEIIADVLRQFAWIMAESVLGEGEKAKKRYIQKSLGFTLTIITKDASGKKRQRIIEGSQQKHEKYTALWVSGFPYVYKLPYKVIEIMAKLERSVKK